MCMVTVEKVGNKVKGVYDDEGKFKGVLVGQIFRFIATWKGEMYKGIYFHHNEKVSPVDELKVVFKSNQLQKVQQLVKI